MSDNKNKTGLIIGAVFIAAIGGGYLYFRSLAGGKALTPIAAAQLIPQDALFAGYISTDSETWSKLDNFGTPEAEKLLGEPIEEQLEKASKEKFLGEEINYEEDIQPWLGNIMLAALPSETEEPEVMMVVGIKDKAKALQFIDKLKKKTESNIETSKYKGITIIENKDESEAIFKNIGILDNEIVISPERKTIETAIDTYKGNSSFADKKGAKEILSKAGKNKNTLFQLYVPNYNGLMRQYINVVKQNAGLGIDTSSLKMLEQQLDRLDYVDSMVVSIGIKENRGIFMQSIAKYKPDFKLPKYPDLSGQVLSQIPGNSLVLISSGGISQAWSWFLEEFGNDPEFKEGLEQARDSLKTTANLDLDKDIISWMDREFAISMIPNDLPPAFVSGTVVITTSDRPTAENTLEKLEKLAKSNGAPIKDKEVAGKEITEYQNYPGGQVVLAYGWLDDNSLAISIGDKADRIVELKSSDSLAENQNFKESIKDFPKKNLGYFYINFQEVNAQIDRLSKTYSQPVPPEAKAFLDSIKGIIGVNTMPDSSTIEQQLLIELVTKE